VYSLEPTLDMVLRNGTGTTTALVMRHTNRGGIVPASRGVAYTLSRARICRVKDSLEDNYVWLIVLAISCPRMRAEVLPQ